MEASPESILCVGAVFCVSKVLLYSDWGFVGIVGVSITFVAPIYVALLQKIDPPTPLSPLELWNDLWRYRYQSACVGVLIGLCCVSNISVHVLMILLCPVFNKVVELPIVLGVYLNSLICFLLNSQGLGSHISSACFLIMLCLLHSSYVKFNS